jgi:enamine deaminase RidA (YjgF/YER057c/UK114 family)
VRFINPESWQQPRGYNNGVVAEGRFLAVAGQIGWNERCEFISDNFLDQAVLALQNVVEVVRAAGGTPQNIVRLTWYVTDRKDYIAVAGRLGVAYRDIMGSYYPAMTLVEVASLLEERAKVEIEATAVLPQESFE